MPGVQPSFSMLSAKAMNTACIFHLLCPKILRNTNMVQNAMPNLERRPMYSVVRWNLVPLLPRPCMYSVSQKRRPFEADGYSVHVPVHGSQNFDRAS